MLCSVLFDFYWWFGNVFDCLVSGVVWLVVFGVDGCVFGLLDNLLLGGWCLCCRFGGLLDRYGLLCGIWFDWLVFIEYLWLLLGLRLLT